LWEAFIRRRYETTIGCKVINIMISQGMPISREIA